MEQRRYSGVLATGLAASLMVLALYGNEAPGGKSMKLLASPIQRHGISLPSTYLAPIVRRSNYRQGSEPTAMNANKGAIRKTGMAVHSNIPPSCSDGKEPWEQSTMGFSQQQQKQQQQQQQHMDKSTPWSPSEPTPRRKVLQGSSALGAAVAGLLTASSLDLKGLSMNGPEAQAATMAVEQVDSAPKADSSEVVDCLFQQCRLELFACLANTVCAANLVCLSQCTGKPDESACQVRCGDLFQTSAIDRFNDCAISRGKCVKQRLDDGGYPVPPPEALVSEFDASKFTGDWYITLGENELFDTFDCQLHTFSWDEKSKMLSGQIRWRVSTPDGGFLQRSAIQTFKQQDEQPSLLINDGNDFLNYSDNWYVASAQLEGKDTDHVFVYYRGSNDAWDGYGGAVLYTRQATMPKALEPIVKKSCAKLPTVKYANLRRTNNECKAAAPLIQRLEATTEKVIEEESKVLVNAIEKEEKVIPTTRGCYTISSSVSYYLNRLLRLLRLSCAQVLVNAIEKEEKVLVKAIEKEEEQIFSGIEERVLALEGEYYKDEEISARMKKEVVNDLAFFLKGVGRDFSEAEKGVEGYAKRLGNAIVQGEQRLIAKENNNIFAKFIRAITREEEKVLKELEMDVKDVEQLLAKAFGSGASSQSRRTSGVTGLVSGAAAQ
eukprot:jgi/Bigna1/87646/estExt_fgenesh1_pg.C_220169